MTTHSQTIIYALRFFCLDFLCFSFWLNTSQDYPHVVYGPPKKHPKPITHTDGAVVPDRPVDQEQNANNNNVDDDHSDDSQASSSEEEDWEHSVATSAIDPSDESSEDNNNEEVDDEVFIFE